MSPFKANLIVFCVVILYFTPVLSAKFRHHRNTSAIFLLNLFLGWTVLGWIGAAVWSATNNVESKAVRS